MSPIPAPDLLLYLVATEALVLARSRPALRPVAGALLAYAALALLDGRGMPLVVQRASFAWWGGVPAVLAMAIWKRKP